MLLDTLATRYHLLPSQVLSTADTLDVLVADVAINWHNAKMEEHQAIASGKPKPVNMPVNKLEEMLKATRSGT